MSGNRIIGLISGKGGVGKTSICVNLGIALADYGNEVTVVDADFSASNLGVYLGRYDHPVKIQQVLHETAETDSAIFRHPSGIKALTSSNEIDMVEPDTSNFRQVLEKAAEQSDYVLVDCPPGLNQTVETVMASCDELMIVSMPTQTSGINAAQIIEKAKQMKKPILGTIVNKVEDDPEMELIEREIEMMTESNILSKIPYDNHVKKSLFENMPLLLHEPLSPAALEIKELAAQIDGQEFQRPSFPGVRRKFKQIKQNITN
jgi:flagellar biosynthesis protein FlhG